MSIQINDGFLNNSPKPLDNWYHKSFVAGVSIPYASTSEVNSTIPSAYRSLGLTVLINAGNVNKEYWYKDGVTDGDLIEKDVRVLPGSNVTVTQLGNTFTINASAQSVGDSSTMETFNATGNFSKTFAAGTILNAFLLVPPDNNTYIISVGTTPGGGEVFNQVSVMGSDPQFFEYLKYFKTAQTWYFTGVPANTQTAILYRPQITPQLLS